MEFSGRQAISDTLEILKQRIGPLIGLAAAFFGIQLGAGIVFGILNATLGMSGMGSEMAAGVVILSLLQNLVNLYLGASSSAAITSTASPITKSPFSAAMGIGFRAAPWLLLFYLVMGLGFVVIAVVFGVVFYGIGAIGGQTPAILLGLVIGLPLLIYLGTKLSMVTPIVAIDGVRNPIEAIGKSWRMTDGAALKIFLVQMAFGLIMLVFLLVFFTPVAISIASAIPQGGVPDFAGMAGGIAWAFLGLILLILLAPGLSAALVSAMHAQLSGAAGGQIGDTFA